MDLGLFGINMNFLAQPAWAVKVAQHAEVLGFESLWTGEHVVLPDPREAPSPADPQTPMLHPSAQIAYMAAVTDRIKFGTGIFNKFFPLLFHDSRVKIGMAYLSQTA